MSRVSVVVAVVALVVAGQAHAGRSRTPPRTHRVAPGDTLGALARRYGTSVAELARANRLADPDRIRIGAVLVVPASDVPASDVPASAAPATLRAARSSSEPALVIGEGDRRHTVEPGDTLGALARRYGTSVAELARANRLADPDRIRIGAVLVVPGPPWVCPVDGGPRFEDDWGAPRDGGRRHEGVDLFAPRGTPVLASVDGTVTHAPGPRAGLAFYLRGDDGHTYYGAHLDSLGPAGRVARGDRVGTVGTTGNASATAPHLHFELKPDGGPPVSPFPTLARWC